ncbi:MAG: hypothetical protein AAF957_28520 [Planctomycetota bacterium]
MILRSIALLACLVAGAPALAGPQENAPKSALRVLLVAHDPSSPQVSFPDMATERTHALYSERRDAFAALLREHFQNVRVVHASQYTPAMSGEEDVTVFDARPARELDRSFSHPALMIGETSPRMGEPLGLKLDWL